MRLQCSKIIAMHQPAYIVYQCYGNEGIFYECAYALMSLSRLYSAAELSNVQIWIYTDKPAWFAQFRDCPLPLHFRALDQATIRQWRGAIDFVHRVKIELLKDLCSKVSGNILYTDTDTVFTHKIDNILAGIAEGRLYMHVAEGVVSGQGNPVLKKLNGFLHSGTAPQDPQRPLYDREMWNAGVLGFSTAQKEILDEVLQFTDSVYPGFPKHIVEQFAFSVKFQQRGPVKAAAPCLLHYWNLKEARAPLGDMLAHFKNAPWATLVRCSTLLQMHVLMQEKVNFYRNRSVMDKLLKKHWQPATYNWDALMQQL